MDRGGIRDALSELAGKGLVYGLGASFTGLVSFLLIPFYTSHLSASEYGRYALAEMVLNLILVLQALGMNVAVLARYPNVPAQERNTFFASVLSFMLLWTVVFQVGFLVLARLIGGTVLPVLDMRMFALVGAISALETVWLLFVTLYRAQGSAWRYIAASGLQAAVGAAMIVYLITRRGLHEEGILVGRLVGDVSVSGTLLVLQLARFGLSSRFAPARDLLRIGLPLIPATFASMWVLNAPRYFLEWYGSVADVGVFAMSSKIASVLQLAYIQPFAMAWMVSLFTIFKRPDANRIYARVLTYYLLLGVALALTLGLVARVAVPLLAHQSFPLSSAIVLIVALAQVAAGLMYPLNIGPYVMERTGKQMPVFVASGILITAIGIIMVRLWGALGGAVALVSVYLTQAVLLWRVSQRLYRVEFEWGRVARLLTAAGTAFLAARAVGLVGSSTTVQWLLAPVFLATFALALFAFRFLDPAEVSNLRAAAGRILRA